MAGEQFSLCWDNFHKNMSSGMHSLLESEDLVDVTLAVEGKYLKAHKMVLSVCSPYFRELFQSNPCKHPIVFMKDVSYVALSDLLTFMYQGEVQVNQENLATFIKTAEALQIKGLTGDGNGEVNEVPDDSPPPEQNSKRTLHEVDEVQTPRAKKPMTQPTKRPKPQSVPEAKIPKTEMITLPGTPSTEQIIQFKMEPYESGDQSNIENTEDSQVDNFVDESVDEGHIDETEDYSMLEGEEEPQAGTSGDAVGDSQGQAPLTKIITRKEPNMGIVVDGFVYHQNSVKRNSEVRYLVCSEYKRLVCRARALLPINGSSEDLVLTRNHNHPPFRNIEDKYYFLRSLKELVKSTHDFPLKEAYDTIQMLYPKGAEMCPYTKIISAMRRWRYGDWHFMNCTERKRRKRKSGPGVRFVINGYVYHTNLVAGTPPLRCKLDMWYCLTGSQVLSENKLWPVCRYLGCVEIKKSQCKGRATLPVDGTPDQIRLTQPHNHLPDSKAEIKDAFMKELKISLQTMTYASCTEIYDIVAKKYPEGAEEIPYRMVCARLYRWKKNCQF